MEVATLDLGSVRRFADADRAGVGGAAGRFKTPEQGAKGVYPYAVDPDEAARLWDLPVDLTGVSFARG